MLMSAATASPQLTTVLQNGAANANAALPTNNTSPTPNNNSNSSSNNNSSDSSNANGSLSPTVMTQQQQQQQQQQTSIVSPTTATMTIPTATALQPVAVSLPGSAAALMPTLPVSQNAAAAAMLTAAAAAAASHPSQKDTTWTKLFVGGLPYHTTDKSLREHFEGYGEIEEAVVITDRQTGKSRGYGFVIMATKDSAERACKEPNPIIDGRKANVNLAILGAKPRGNSIQGLPLAALPRFPTLLPTATAGQYGDLTSVMAAAQAAQAAQQLGVAVSLPSAAQAAIAAQAAATCPVTAAALQAVAGQTAGVPAAPAVQAAAATAGGKTRSSLSLQYLSGRVPTAVSQTAAASNPYLQSMYAAATANPYANAATGLPANASFLPLTASLNSQTPLSTGNPLFDAYASQYAALYGAAAPVNGAAAVGTSADMTALQQATYLAQAGYAYSLPTANGLQAAYAAGPTTATAGPTAAAAATADARLQ